MSRFVLLFASGAVFFPGLVLCAAATALAFRFRGRKWRLALRIGAVLGAILVLASATPLPVWAYALWIGLLLGATLKLDVTNLSSGGAKVRSSLHKAQAITDENALVVLEIGGNDVLSQTEPNAFRADLDQLLADVCRPKRLVVMLELPLPPFHNAYGSAQRSLARAYGVSLVPKRFFARVLGAPNATVDGLHLSNTGHQLMADTLAGMFETE